MHNLNSHSLIFHVNVEAKYCIQDLDIPGLMPVPRFSRTVYGPVVHLSNIPQEDVIPPSKIGDLLITPSDNKETVINSLM